MAQKPDTTAYDGGVEDVVAVGVGKRSVGEHSVAVRAIGVNIRRDLGGN